MVIVGLPYAFQGQMGIDEVKGGSPYGASTITGGDGSRQPSEIELDAARFQSAHVAGIAVKLVSRSPPANACERGPATEPRFFLSFGFQRRIAFEGRKRCSKMGTTIPNLC